MTESILGLVPAYGPLAVFFATILSCFGFPVPGSLVLLAAGSFVASGEMALGAVLFVGLAGAISGDQAGYWLGKYWGESVVLRLPDTLSVDELAHQWHTDRIHRRRRLSLITGKHGPACRRVHRHAALV